MPLSKPHVVTLSGPRLRSTSIRVDPRPGELLRRVEATLPTAMGSIKIESEPSGAEVRVDDRPAGTTPLTLGNVRLDERHRVDLVLPGYEIDQFVVLPEMDGRRFVRRLAPSERRGPSLR